MVSRQLAVGIAIGVSVAFVLTTMKHVHSKTPVRSIHLQREARLHARLDGVIKNLTVNRKISDLEEKLRQETLHHDEELKKNEELLQKQEELIKKQEVLVKEKEELVKEQEELVKLQVSEKEKDTQADVINKLKAFQSDIGDKNIGNNDNETLAEKLKKKIRVLVWVMTMPKNLRNQATAVKNTWGKRANKLIFMSSKTNKKFPTVGLDVREGRNHLTAKTMKAFRYVYENYFDDYDWFMKADDDTFVIMENLRFFLSAYNTSEPIYFGHLFQALVKQGYYSGGAGYVLSKESLRRLYINGTDPNLCQQDGGVEDGCIGHCMKQLGVRTMNTTDSKGRSRFHSLDASAHMDEGRWMDWMYRFEADGVKVGADSISDYAISFHYVHPKEMYQINLWLYKMKAYGIPNVNDDGSLNAPQENRLLREGENKDYMKVGCVMKGNCKEILKKGGPWI